MSVSLVDLARCPFCASALNLLIDVELDGNHSRLIGLSLVIFMVACCRRMSICHGDYAYMLHGYQVLYDSSSAIRKVTLVLPVSLLAYCLPLSRMLASSLLTR